MMNNVTDTESLVEFYCDPGMTVGERAILLHTGTPTSCDELYSSLCKMNSIMGDKGYRYNILPTAMAARITKETNDEYVRCIIAWRNEIAVAV